MSKRLYAAGFALLATGCASERVTLEAAPGQNAFYRNGVPALVSAKSHVVFLRPSSRLLRSGDRPAFTVAVKNLGNRPVTIFEQSVRAQALVAGRRSPVRVIRSEELFAEERTRQGLRTFGTALAGVSRAMAAANSGYTYTNGSFNTFTTGSVNYTNRYGSTYGKYSEDGRGTFSMQTYDSSRAQAAQRAASTETQYEMRQVAEEGERNLAMLESTLLSDNTVMPGEWYGGVIVLERLPAGNGAPKRCTVIVEFAGEEHAFEVAYGSG